MKSPFITLPDHSEEHRIMTLQGFSSGLVPAAVATFTPTTATFSGTIVANGPFIANGTINIASASPALGSSTASGTTSIALGPSVAAAIRNVTIGASGVVGSFVNIIAGGTLSTNTMTIRGNILLDKTSTPPGTTGAQTINKTTGSVNFAAAATSLVVTNSLVTASSIIMTTVGSSDATMSCAKAVAAAGSFTLYCDIAPTAETIVNFSVTN